MDVIAEIVKNLLVIIIMSSFLEIILPDGNIKPFVRFAIGLFVLIAVLSPSLAYLYSDKNLQISVWDERVSDDLSKKIEAGGQKIRQEIESQQKQQIKQKLEGQISAVTVLIPGVDDVHAQAFMGDDGSLQKLQVTVRPGVNQAVEQVSQVNALSDSSELKNDQEKADIQNKLVQIINNLYGLNAENIEIKFEGG